MVKLHSLEASVTATDQEQVAPVLSDGDDTLDWDVWIEAPPPRPTGTILVKLEFAGRGKPAPVEDPWAE